MNEMGFKFLQTGLGEYIYVHDYENLMDFDYYFNIFQPECVVVEVAEYTVNSGYFNAERVENFSLNSVLTLDYAARQADREDLSPQIVEGERLSTLTVSLPEGTRYAYLLSEGRTFDLIEGEQRASRAGRHRWRRRTSPLTTPWSRSARMGSRRGTDKTEKWELSKSSHFFMLFDAPAAKPAKGNP